MSLKRTRQSAEPVPDERPASGDPSFYRNLLESLYDGVYFVDRKRRITYWNQGAARLTGYQSVEAIGRSCFDNFLQHIDENGCALCVKGCPLLHTMQDGQPREAEIYLRHKMGHRVAVSVRAAPIRDQTGHIIGAVEIFSDISAKKNVERRARKLVSLAFQDPLTGLANRRYTTARIQQEIQDVRQFGKSTGILMIDVDEFKNVNDTYGHEAGDLVLRAVSQTLVGNLRPSDLVGRWGGEEFVVILGNADLILLKTVAERCRMLAAATRVTLGNSSIAVTISIGATLLLPTDSDHSAIQRADDLMYRSKNAGRNSATFG